MEAGLGFGVYGQTHKEEGVEAGLNALHHSSIGILELVEENKHETARVQVEVGA